MSKAVLVDLRRCIGCKACQVACKRWNDREATNTELNSDSKLEWTNPQGLSLQTYSYVKFVKTGSQDSLAWTFAKIQCNHCIQPQCVKVCPTTAMIKTDEGPVKYRRDLCIACASCVHACPFSVPKLDENNKVIEKCTFCVERLNENMEPACVQACPTHTLVVTTLEDAQSKANMAKNAGFYTYGLSEFGGTSWIYISKVPFAELGFPGATDSPPSTPETPPSTPETPPSTPETPPSTPETPPSTPETPPSTPETPQPNIINNFAGIGLIAGGALLAGMYLYSQRKREIDESKGDE